LAKGDGGRCKTGVLLNDTASTQYRCFKSPMLGHHVSTSLISFHLDNLHQFRLFESKYEQSVLVVAGIMILTSGILDMFSTVLVVGKTAWAYPWIATELFIIVTKVFFCIEPLRFTEIKKVRDQTTGQVVHMPNGKKIKLPLGIQSSEEWHCHALGISPTTLQDRSSNELFVVSTAEK
jgi:hypothetical protein